MRSEQVYQITCLLLSTFFLLNFHVIAFLMRKIKTTTDTIVGCTDEDDNDEDDGDGGGTFLRVIGLFFSFSLFGLNLISHSAFV